MLNISESIYPFHVPNFRSKYFSLSLVSVMLAVGFSWISFIRFRKFTSVLGLLSIFFKILFIYLFIYVFIYFYFWLCWVFISVRGLFLVVASGGHSSSWCVGLSLSWPLSLWSTSSRCAGSVVVVHGPSCSAACGIFPDQGSNPCPLHWQADSQPLCHQ